MWNLTHYFVFLYLFILDKPQSRINMHKHAVVMSAGAQKEQRSDVTIDCSFRGVKPVFIPGDYSRRHTGLAETRKAKKDNNKLKEYKQVKKRERYRY